MRGGDRRLRRSALGATRRHRAAGRVRRPLRGPATVVTFDPSPASVLAPEQCAASDGTLEQRLEGLAPSGFEQVRVLDLRRGTRARVRARLHRARPGCSSQGARAWSSARTFTSATIARAPSRSSARSDGPNGFRRRRRADARRRPSVEFDRGARCAGRGDLAGASTILGRPFTLRGVVVHGDARGEALGFPTANLAWRATSPARARASTPGRRTSRRPGGRPRSRWARVPSSTTTAQLLVEVHVVDFAATSTVARSTWRFSTRLRDQTTFDSVEELVAQIERDVEETRQIFERTVASTSRSC